MARQGRRWPIGFLLAAFLVVFLAACDAKPKGPIRSIENGIEVVDNGSGYYSVPGQPRSLALREEFRIDLEDEKFAAAGLTDVSAIDADVRGRIFVFGSGLKSGPFVFQFDDKGSLMRSFCLKGQGPAEVEFPVYFGMTASSEILIHSTSRFVVFDLDGEFLRQERIEKWVRFVGLRQRVLANGNILAPYIPENKEMVAREVALALFDGRLNKQTDIRSHSLPETGRIGQNPLAHVPIFGASASVFFTNGGDEGRDIAVFDLDGRPKRIIRADFPSRQVPEAYKKDIIERWSKAVGDDTWKFIASLSLFPPFQSLAVDEKGFLFVSTLDRDPDSGAYLNDVFSPEGVRLFRVGLGYQDYIRDSFNNSFLDVVLKNGRAYCVREKESGFKEVVVYRMDWK